MLFPFICDALKTITTDNGSEFMLHRQFARKLKTKVFLPTHTCSWQKDAIKSANKLMRQYFPKGTDFNLISKDKIIEIQKKINRSPRKN